MQNLKIILKSSNGEATAILDDTAVARSFAAQLPLTLNLSDYAGHEKTAKLPKPLDVSSEPRGREAPPIKGTLADKVGETALVRTGYTPGGKPILRWVHYAKLKKEI